MSEDFDQNLFGRPLDGRAVAELIKQLLLTLMLVEIVYIVQVSFSEHTIAPEPFLLIRLIAGVRRVLVITAELAEKRNQAAESFQFLMLELGVLTFLVPALVAPVVMLRQRRGGPSAAEGTPVTELRVVGGGGCGGLAAAARLSGLGVTVFAARDKPGGRASV